MPSQQQIVLAGIVLLSFVVVGTAFAEPGVTQTAADISDETTSNITITVTDSRNGQDSANVTVDIAQDSEQPGDLPENLPEDISTDQFNAIDANGDSSVTLGELVSANIERINNDGTITDSNGDAVSVSLGDLVQLNVWRVNNGG